MKTWAMKKTALNLLCLYVLLMLSPLRVLADNHAPHCSESVADSLHSPVNMSDHHGSGLDETPDSKDQKQCGILQPVRPMLWRHHFICPTIETPFIPAAPFNLSVLWHSTAPLTRCVFFDRPPRA